MNGTAIDEKLDGGASGQASLSGIAPGTYAVVCTLHPQMAATLQVRAQNPSRSSARGSRCHSLRTFTWRSR